MLVIMRFPGERGGHGVLRRVVGLPGDTLAMRAGVLTVNGTAPGWPFRVTEPQAEPPLDGPVRGAIDFRGPLVVGGDSAFVLSDLRDMREWPDSRFPGPIARSFVEEENVALLVRAGQ